MLEELQKQQLLIKKETTTQIATLFRMEEQQKQKTQKIKAKNSEKNLKE